MATLFGGVLNGSRTEELVRKLQDPSKKGEREIVEELSLRAEAAGFTVFDKPVLSRIENGFQIAVMVMLVVDSPQPVGTITVTLESGKDSPVEFSFFDDRTFHSIWSFIRGLMEYLGAKRFGPLPERER